MSMAWARNRISVAPPGLNFSFHKVRWLTPPANLLSALRASLLPAANHPIQLRTQALQRLGFAAYAKERAVRVSALF